MCADGFEPHLALLIFKNGNDIFWKLTDDKLSNQFEGTKFFFIEY